MSSRIIFEMRGVQLRRGTAAAARTFDCALGRGQWCVLTGENGSGKTTLLRVLCGLSEAERGVVCWQGSPISCERPAYHSALLYIGHKLGFRGNLSISENLTFYRDLEGRHGTESIYEAMDYFDISDAVDCPYAALSHGQKQRAALCRLMTECARMWLLDEPTAALDRQGHDLFEALLAKHLGGGGVAVVATHKPFSQKILKNAERLSL